MDWQDLESLAEHELYGNSILLWLTALATAALLFLILLAARGLFARRLSAEEGISERRRFVIGLVGRLVWPTLLVAAVFAGAYLLDLPPKLADVIAAVAIVTLFLQAGLIAGYLFQTWTDRYVQRHADVDPAVATTMGAANFLGRVAIWSLVLLLLLDNLGVDVTALVAGFGIGGIAIAFAAQTILADLFASLSIVLDKPFVVGDFIILGEFLGTVEHVGIKTTRLRSLSGEQIVISNNDLLQSRIRNYKRMFERRVLFRIGVVYQTPHEALRGIPDMLREAILEQPTVRFDRAHFAAYGDFALLFEVVYYVLDSDYNLYMDRQQAINLAIHERFLAEGIEFAYPTQTLHLEATDRLVAAFPRPAAPLQ